MTSGEKTIMLVEDNADDEALTIKALKKCNINSNLIVARDGAEALDYLFGKGAHEGRDTTVMPNLMLLDLKLPKVDGLEVLRRVRSSELTKMIPVVVLTLSKEEADLLASYRFGANSYIRKPVDFSHFLEVVRQIGQYWLGINEGVPRKGDS